VRKQSPSIQAEQKEESTRSPDRKEKFSGWETGARWGGTPEGMVGTVWVVGWEQRNGWVTAEGGGVFLGPPSQKKDLVQEV